MKPLVFLLYFIPHFCCAQELKLFVPEDQAFQVLIPGKMDWGIKHVLTDLGELKTITYLHKNEGENPDIIYIINYTDYPAGVLDVDSIELLESFFQTSLDGIREKLTGDLVYYADVSSFYIPQKIYKIVYNNGQALVKGKMMIVADRFYSIQVFSSFVRSNASEIQTFLDSFLPLHSSP